MRYAPDNQAFVRVEDKVAEMQNSPYMHFGSLSEKSGTHSAPSEPLPKISIDLNRFDQYL